MGVPWSSPISSEVNLSHLLAKAIKMRAEFPTKGFLRLLNSDPVGITDFDRIERMPNGLDLLVLATARKSNLEDKIMSNLNPIEFACSTRDSELLFMLEQKPTKLA
jgi:hypothetical protein